MDADDDEGDAPEPTRHAIASMDDNDEPAGFIPDLEDEEEDLGRQVLANKKHVSASELCKKVDAMTAGDIQRVARDMLNTELTVVAHGDTKKMPKLNVRPPT